ncbi:DUF6233 domain-containing protein [Streptomyces turgidiscabies]|uniref:Uncharacterized protein n=1 Tax=Streptomyces turgidiscabies (strain Car8) TaxID=698760 RepID=L7EZN3_STRT8|nr:DUF6233 domain-containing protein [Streptomyces turgidiscabies]ELP64161.1 hypothetical protein STRTUCAR8_05568 [Streptomyces turgidiscabies Car8]MDX3492124.1 DUF6233 domain-containing protein [Streptomyces turgidiscabies]
MNELPPDPPRLRAILAHLDQQLAQSETIATYLRLQRDAVHRALTKTEHAASPQQRRQPPAKPKSEYVSEREIHKGHPLGCTIHVGGCGMVARPVTGLTAEEARRALTRDAQFFHPCELCRPDTALGILE